VEKESESFLIQGILKSWVETRTATLAKPENHHEKMEGLTGEGS